MAAADLDTINSTQAAGVQVLGQIYKALLGGFTNFVPAPASAAAAGTAGQVAIDSGFIYICIATNTWKRVAISTF